MASVQVNPVAFATRVDKVGGRAQFSRAVRVVLVVVYAVISMIPVFWMVTAAFKSRPDVLAIPPKIVFEPTLEGVISLLTKRSVLAPGQVEQYKSRTDLTFVDKLMLERGQIINGPSQYTSRLWNSVIVAGVSTLLSVFLGVLAAYAFSRFNVPGKGDLLFFILSTRMLPAVVVTIPVFLMYQQLKLYDTHLGLILLYTVFNLSFSVWLLKGFIDEIPKEYEEAALVDGYSRLQAFRRVVLPQAITGIAATFVFCLIFAWNEYAFALMLTSEKARTAPPSIPTMLGTGGIEWSAIAAGSLGFLIPVIIITFVLRDYLLRGVTFGAIKKVTMANIELQQVEKRFGTSYAVRPLDLTIHDGEFVALLGPSGCGKTTTLRMIAGLETTSGGKIILNGKDVTRLKPSERDVAMVFQFFALYPHLTAKENVAFPLQAEGESRERIEQRVREVAEMLRIEPLLKSRPGSLSSGDQQRVALARALVRRPACFLMDEPLGALDADFRESMRSEIKQLHIQQKGTTVYVTHDQIEAMAMADRIVIMSQGVVQQVGTPAEVYHAPVNLFVARFIGSPGMNLVKGEWAGDSINLPGGNRYTPAAQTRAASYGSGRSYRLSPRRCCVANRWPAGWHSHFGRLARLVHHAGHRHRHE